MRQTLLTEEYVRLAVAAAIDTLCAADEHLLAANCSERSLSHMFAVHLSSKFPGYNVDCEYNRDGFNVKKLMLGDHLSTTSEALDAVTVFPDVIVHKRGTSVHNLLVVEIKKASSADNGDFDIRKLQAFKAQMAYEFAAFIVVGYRTYDRTCLIKAIEWQ